MTRLQYNLVHTGSVAYASRPYRAAVEPTLERQPAARPMAWSKVTPDKEIISMDRKKTDIYKKKKLRTRLIPDGP